MDTTLVTVTLLSMAMAASLSVIVWRMLRDERQRSEARVVALTAMAARPSNPALRGSTPAPSASHLAPRASHLASSDSTAAPRASHLAPRDPDLDLEIREAPVSAAAMFAERKVASPWGHRFAAMTGLGLVVASVILFSLTSSGRTAARRAPAPGNAAAGTAQPGTNAATVVGLELLSLRDSRQPGSLTITGLVQNPRGGSPLSRVTVTAYAFDDKGAFLASGRALIDVTALAPGDESPFVVAVPVTETVARYRIGFRGEDGRVIAHIDRRQQAPVAALRLGSGHMP
jgi:hypothetical protein